MFQAAIEKVASFTRPIHTILRTYGGKQIIPGAATLFFVNEEGYAVTCKHVIKVLAASDKLTENYNAFKKERAQLPRDGKYRKNLKGLELKYKLNPETEIQIKNTFVDCVDSMTGFTWHLHPKYDLAILKFNDFKTLHYKDFAIFKKDTSQIKQGEFLCRLGFPFPEFNNFRFDESTDEIEWTQAGIKTSPRFPLEGMVTRFLAEENKVYGIEMSTPGLKGQSGGPLFNQEGIVYGMQFSTKHLHLGFDIVEKEVLLNHQIKKISDHAFIHLGQCIHADIIKEFLKLHQVKYYEE
ncbi:trypsin-like peptidase domain-containing protein [Cecembia sp.]|uniref:trypsin-like peptidase domain-containing protein n=2 Tax=Cecembia sp. TaxID=1898110 RepID=UPI0025C48DD0|nr:trypsin-like peptidase domain-containing protein [Cecembia sp.]